VKHMRREPPRDFIRKIQNPKSKIPTPNSL
jgi:hypothetical protein